MALLLSTYQLSKSFAGKDLFQGVSFGIEEKEKVALLGPNGVGKSTLMKILVKDLQADKGDLTFKKGIKVGYLNQDPVFKKDETIHSYLLEDYNTISKAYELIAKLELSIFPEDKLINELSGGWQKRIALAKSLLNDPDLLLLDEPTNHLDVEGIKWLEEFLSNSQMATLIITHDRLFLQRVCKKILDLDPRFPGHLLTVNDGYEKYLEIKTQYLLEQQVKEQKMANTLKREKEWLARGAIARQTKQKARQESAYSLENELQKVKQLNRIKSSEIEFESAGKGPRKIIEAIHLGQSFNEKVVFKNLDLIVSPKSRLALLGINGAGKTTLIKTLLGMIAPAEGKVKIADDIVISYFEQNKESLQRELSVLKNIAPEGDYVDFQGNFVHVRSYLEKFGFYKEKIDLPVQQLSGGEKARLRIAQLMLKKCNVLVLDEPTNDLDIETLNVLEENLKDFNGAIILVTHDRYFMDQVSNQILAFSPFSHQSGELFMFASYSQWEDWYELTSLEEKNNAKKIKDSANESAANKQKKLSFKEKFELENMESTILEFEKKLQALNKEINDPTNVSNSSKISELYDQLNMTQKKVDELYQRWTELEQKK